MQKQFPMTSVPNLQGYPENGFPVSAYYGVDSTLAVMGTNSASSATGGASALVQQLDPSAKFRQLAIVLLCVVGAYVLWHFFTK